MIDEVPQEPGQRPPGGPAQGAAPVPQPTSPSAWPEQGGQWPQQQPPYPQQQPAYPQQQPGQQYPPGPYQPGVYQPGPQQWSAPPQQQTGWQGAPASGIPYAEQPSSGVPAQGWSQTAGTWGAPADTGGNNGDFRRIVPSEPPKNRKLAIILSAGIVVAALAAGAGGYFLGDSRAAADPQPAPTTGTQPDPATLPAYEASQVTINRTKLDGELEPLAAPWLNVVGGCVGNGDKDGPKLGTDESRHTFCRYSAVSLHFIVFKSGPEKDSARTFRSQLNLNSDGIAPGIEPSGRKAGGATNAQGKYVEYAYRDGNGRAFCGIWWERDDAANAAVLLETPCEEGLGGKWDPLRDLWKRHSCGGNPLSAASSAS